MGFQLMTTAFRDGESIPRKFTCDGPDVSPALSWSDPPAGTKMLALIADDPDAPGGTWVHWVLYDLPADERKLPEGVSKDRELQNGALQGRNDFGKFGYNGPCPPRGAAHRYFFKLYALDSKTGLKSGATKGEVERAMRGRVLAETKLTGTYQH
jgi:Raf kinase inhibitor-like YbhB/YbcL family protein